MTVMAGEIGIDKVGSDTPALLGRTTCVFEDLGNQICQCLLGDDDLVERRVVAGLHRPDTSEGALVAA